MEEMRLNKYLAHSGICSRRDADRLIAEGKVSVNGFPAESGAKVGRQDRVTVSGRLVENRHESVVLAFYKPLGVVCTERDSHAETILTDVVNYPGRVAYAGRLDKDSEGLMLLCSDGDLIQAMMRGANRHEKEYLVRVDREVTPQFILRMSQGIYLEDLDVTTRECRLEKVNMFTFRIVLTQGVNRQIKRMCQACGYRVRALKRIRVMHVMLGDLEPGEYRRLGKRDVERLYEDCGLKAPEPCQTEDSGEQKMACREWKKGI